MATRMTTIVSKITTVLPVPSVEESLPFWQALGFEVSMSVPDGTAIGFAILVKDACEVMLQSYASIAGDLPAIGELTRGAVGVLFIEVDDLQAGIDALAAFEMISPRRETFYGSVETTWKEPSGHLVTLAQFAKDASAPS